MLRWSIKEKYSNKLKKIKETLDLFIILLQKQLEIIKNNKILKKEELEAIIHNEKSFMNQIEYWTE